MRAPPIVEILGHAARRLQVGQRLDIVAPPRGDRGKRHQQAHLEIGVDLQAGANTFQQRREQAARIRLLVGQVEAIGEPVARQRLVGDAAQRSEDARRLGRRGDRLLAPIQPRERLGAATQNLGPPLVVGRLVEEVGVAIGRCLPVAGGQQHVDLQPVPGRVALVEEVARRKGEAFGEVAQRHHRWSRDARFERAHIGLGIAVAGELLLRQPRAFAGFPDPDADLARQGGVVLCRLGDGPGAWH